MPTVFLVTPPRAGIEKKIFARTKNFFSPQGHNRLGLGARFFYPTAFKTLYPKFCFPTVFFSNFFSPHSPRRTPLQLNTYVHQLTYEKSAKIQSYVFDKVFKELVS